MTDRLAASKPPSGPNTSWLDEELRKEKALVQELRDTVARQQVAFVDQNQRVMALESALAKLEGQLARIPGVEQALEHTRDELVLRMAELREERQKGETEFLRNRQAEREQDSRAIQEIMLALGRIGPLEQGLAVREAEDLRLNESLLRLEQALDEVRRHLLRGEESGRQLADAIEKNGVAIQQTALGLEEERKRQRALAERMPAIETTMNRLEQQVSALQDMRKELTAQYDEFLEIQRRSEQARAQTMTEWGRKLDGYAHQLEVWSDQIRFYGDQHEKNRAVLREVQEVSQEVSQQQDRLRQLQRIAEEQLRRELLELRSELDRRWAREEQRREAAAEAQAGLDDAQDKRLAEAESQLENQRAVLDELAVRLAAVRSEQMSATEQLSSSHRHAWSALADALQDVAATLVGDGQDRRAGQNKAVGRRTGPSQTADRAPEPEEEAN
jgi:chromosome segregation ATPase